MLDERVDQWHDGVVVNLLKLVFVILGAVVLLEACASKQTVTKSQVRNDAWGRPEQFSVGKDKDGKTFYLDSLTNRT